MKNYIASLKYAGGSTYKFNLVADMIRNKDTISAVNILRYSVKSHAKILLNLLNSCIANATFSGTNKNILFIKNINVGKAFTLKRITPRGRGRMSRIEKRYTSIEISLSEKDSLENKKTLSKSNYGSKN